MPIHGFYSPTHHSTKNSEFRFWKIWIGGNIVGAEGALAQKRVLPPSRRGSYLWPPWTVLAEILGDDSSMFGLSCVRILLGYMKFGGSYLQNRAKNAKKRVRFAIRRGSYLGPPWTVLAEILGDNSPIVGLSCVWISLGCDEARGSSVQKRPKNGPKNRARSWRFPPIQIFQTLNSGILVNWGFGE